MASLGIGTTFHQAFGALWLRRRVLGPIIGGWLVAEFLFLSGRRYFTQGIWPDIFDRLWPATSEILALDRAYVGHVVAEVPHNLYGAVFVMLVMRVLLFGTPLPGSGPGRVLGRAILSLFLFKMSMSLYYASSQWLALQAADGTAFPAWRTVIWLIGAAVVARLCLIYPNAAMGRGWQLRRSWRDAAGNVFRLLGVYALAVLPGLAIGEGLETVVWLTAVDPAGSLALAALAMVAALERIAISVILLALFAVAFARLTGFQSVDMPGAERTPEQLAEAFD